MGIIGTTKNNFEIILSYIIEGLSKGGSKYHDDVISGILYSTLDDFFDVPLIEGISMICILPYHNKQFIYLISRGKMDK
uniref:Ankyrin repeat protein n=1 Tax=Strongyloides stercoralis TaxID=6248 RepID=A0A0K0E8Z8_STRER